MESWIGLCTHTPAGQRKQPRQPTPTTDPIYITQVSIPSTSKKQTLASKLAEQAGTQMGSGNIPAKYHCHLQVFSKEASQQFPEPHIWDHAIELKLGAPSLTLGKIYQLTQDEQKALLEFIKEQQEKGYIQPSKSPYAAPFFFIKKKDGKLWPVQDYQRLNEWTVKNHYLLPLISELISWVQGAKWFSKVDIRWGYNNICIKEGDEHKAAFITNQGLFEPTVMFFGLMNSPATFQTMMNAIFAEEIAKGWLIVYMDDLLVTTKDDPQFHEECIHQMLKELKKHDLYLKLEKCIFDQWKIEFLGVILENRTVQMDLAKVKGVADWSPPQNVMDICSFLGFTGFYCYFIPNYSLIAQPLIQLTWKNIPFKWGPMCMHAFKHLKSLMCLKPILRQPDYTKAFFLATDASTYGVGAILSQEGELNPRTQKPMLCLVAYYSSMFTPTERNYNIYEREFLGVLKALKHFRPHVTAMEIPVTILTDHTNLTHWKATRKVNRWVTRWFTEIQDYNLVIKHVPGKIHTTPDMLSRPPGVDQGKQDNTDIMLLPPAMFVVTTNTQEDMLKEKVKKVQWKHKAGMELWCNTQGVRKLPEGYVKEWRLAVPSGLVLRWELMAQFHNTPTARHPRRDNTLMLVSQHYWWLGMTSWIEQYVAGCTHCQQNKICTTKRKTPLYHIPGDPSMCPFNIIALDLIMQLPEANGHNTILTIVDQGCSRAAIFIPCNTTITGEGVALLYIQHIFPWFGVPSKVISDRDPWFTSHFAQALTTKLSIGWNISTTFHPQTDGLTECKNQWVEQYLQMYTSVRQDNWNAWLPIVTFVHNHWPNTTTKCSPHKVLLGCHPSAAEEPTFMTNNETVETRHQLINQHQEAALQALNNVVQNTPTGQHKVGDWVWLEAKHLALPYTFTKLAPKHHGPFQIMKEVSPVAYQLELPRAWTIHDIFHSSLLTPYKETLEHGAQFQHPPPELIDNEEEYEVEDIINHWYYGKGHQLQYLIQWKGYSVVDDTWEPADQVHANALVRKYHSKHVKDEGKHKRNKQVKAKTTICLTSLCLPPTQPTSPLPFPQASPSIWTSLKPFLSDPKLTPQWSTGRNPSPSLWQLWQPPTNSVSYNSPLDQCVLLSKDTAPQGKRNSSSLCKDWWELCERIRKSATTTKNNWKYSTREETIWKNVRHMWLGWKKPMNIGRQTMTSSLLTGTQRSKDQKGMRRMKAMSLISSSPLSMVTMSSMSSPHTSSTMDCTVWALPVSGNLSTNTKCFHPSTSPSMKRGSSPTGFSVPSPTTQCTWPCTTTPAPRRTGESQLSSNVTMRHTIKLSPWSQSKGAWLLPLKLPRCSWTKANDTCSAPMPMSGINSSTPSMRAPTLTPSWHASSPPYLAAHAMVQLNASKGVMSQGSLQEGKRTTGIQEWVHLTPRTGRAV